MKTFSLVLLAALGIAGVNALLSPGLPPKKNGLSNIQSVPRVTKSALRMSKEEEDPEEEQEFGGFKSSLPNPFTETVQAGKKLRQNVDSLYNSVINYGRVPEDLYNDIYMNDRILYSQFDSPDQVPEVLVVGATGETGRLIVRKLLLRGFRVRVLVRNLYSETLDLLGPAVTYTQGDLTKKNSLRDAVSGVDKVVIAAAPSADQNGQEVDYYGTLNLLQVFQDMRVLDYGRSLSTKRMLFKFKSDVDRELWNLNEEYRGENRVCWKASEYDGKAVFAGTVTQSYGDVSIESVQMKLNLEPFSGFLMKVKGNGEAFRVVLRTTSYYTDNVQYEAEFMTQKDKWMSVRLPFSNFVPYCDGKRVPEFDELDRSDIEQLAISHRRLPGEASEFYLKLAFMKVYKTQMEPEVVFLSDASIPTDANDVAKMDVMKQQGKTEAYWKAMGESVCRNSGLTYTIIRVSGYNNAPGNYNPITVKQDQEGLEPVSRADVAEIVVQSLLDPRACNLAFYVTNSKFAPSAQTPDEEFSDMLALLQPNT
eukprot:CAMPEP_0117754408 /NCGR_PEP_ID=MMETSP0947-20121206/12813_1 /TAXON_ID=44440 /ORGANISM="Chattonella subsalsa, Strain CCMP2191" /LENGTH=534 /DNA_ID=CAMNT_0005573495 /DNA_START=78 /DNA_END=1682 /DNA_ORIENTATION=-